MTFGLTWTPRPNTSEERDTRTLQLFSKWAPPAGFEFKAFYDYADGEGGIGIVEASSAEVILEAIGPWSTFFSFQIRPVVPSDKGAAIFAKTNAWRDSIR